MLAIIKIDESYAVVDLDEDTELFESLDEAEDMMLEYMSQKRLDNYKRNQEYDQHTAKFGGRANARSGIWHPDEEVKRARERRDNRKKRLKQRAKIIAKKFPKGGFAT